MAENTWPILIRYHLRDRRRVRIPFEAYWDTHGFALRDGEGEEHHFGFAEHEGQHMVFTYVASYSADGREGELGRRGARQADGAPLRAGRPDARPEAVAAGRHRAIRVDPAHAAAMAKRWRRKLREREAES